MSFEYRGYTLPDGYEWAVDFDAYFVTPYEGTPVSQKEMILNQRTPGETRNDFPIHILPDNGNPRWLAFYRPKAEITPTQDTIIDIDGVRNGQTYVLVIHLTLEGGKPSPARNIWLRRRENPGGERIWLIDSWTGNSRTRETIVTFYVNNGEIYMNDGTYE